MTTKKQDQIPVYEDAKALANALLVLHDWASEKAAQGNEDAGVVFRQTARVYFSALRLR